MFRSSHSFMLRSGLVIATMLAIVPTSLIAETTPAQGQDPSPQTSTPQPNATPNSAKGTSSTEQPGTKSKAGAPATSATAKSGTPATPATTATGTKPATESAASTAKPGTPLAPVTAATSTKPAPTAKPGTAAVTATGSSPTTGNGIDSKAPASAVSTNSPPVMETVSLVLNLKEKHVYVYKGDKVLTKYPVAIGKKGWETPVGEWQVMEKVVNPGWTSFKDGSVIKPGKNNPLGERWIGFWTDGKDVIGFHGTPNVKSIGTAASHGCVRMLNSDVKALFPLVKVGTTVKVVAQ
jgi:lipoprotein-anchoring transpeptidase ErfK/SrfK